MKKRNRFLLLSLALAGCLFFSLSGPSLADTIAVWNFNDQFADNGTIANRTGEQYPYADAGIRAASSQQTWNNSLDLGTWGYNAGNFPTTNPANKADYTLDSAVGSADIRYRFVTSASNEGLLWTVDTSGYQNIDVTLGLWSRTAYPNAGQFSFEYTMDGTSWTKQALNYPTGETWLTLTLMGLEGDPDFAFRLISTNATATTMTADWIEVTGNPVPIPAAAWLLGSGLVGLVVIKRRKKF